MKSILDPAFRYIPSFSTDLRRTFARIRRDRLKNAADVVPKPPVTLVKISSIIRTTARGR